MDRDEQNRESLRAIQQVFQSAVENNSIGDMRAHIDPNFSFVSFTDKSFENFDDFEKQWNITRAEMIGNGKFTTELNPEPTVFIGDVAVCKGNASNHMTDKQGNSYEYSANWTVIFKQTDGIWKVLRAHNSLDPFANPMLKSRVKSLIIKSCAIAFILGGIACSLATYLLTR